jgi:hypothetical protein
VTKPQPFITQKQWLIIALLFLFIFAVESAAIQHNFTSKFPGGNDFYSRWAGAKALLLEGRDPYSPDVTGEIEVILDPQQLRANSFSFAYPLHVIFVFWPLVYVDYSWAQAIWMVCLQWIVIASAMLLLSQDDWPRSGFVTGVALFAALFFYPAARAIMLGQFTLHVIFFLILTVGALRQGRDGWAGFFFAATSIKPQMVLLAGLWLVLWAVRWRRWRFIGSTLVSGAGLLVASMLLFPRWPFSFIEDLGRYADRAGGLNPMDVLAGMLLPNNVATLRWGITIGLIVILLFAWIRALRRADDALFDHALYWGIIINLLVFFQTGSPNQILLLLPIATWLKLLYDKWGGWITGIAVLVLTLAPWVLFIATIRGDHESPLLLLPLPILALFILLGRWHSATS